MRDISELKTVKPMNVVPAAIMLVVIVLLIVWLRPH